MDASSDAYRTLWDNLFTSKYYFYPLPEARTHVLGKSRFSYLLRMDSLVTNIWSIYVNSETAPVGLTRGQRSDWKAILDTWPSFWV